MPRGLEIVTLVKFREDINAEIERYIQMINDGTKDDNLTKILGQVITYFEKMKTIHSCREEADDDDCLSDDATDDYSQMMENRTYGSINQPSKPSDNEQEIRRQLFGLDPINDDNSSEDNHYTFISEHNTDDEEEDTNSDPVVNNTKKNFKTIHPEIEVTTSNSDDDDHCDNYDDLKL